MYISSYDSDKTAVEFDDESDDEVISMKQKVVNQMNKECINSNLFGGSRTSWSPFDEDDLSLGNRNHYNGGLGKYYCFEKRKYDSELKEVLEVRRICTKCEQTRLKYLTWRFYRQFMQQQVKKVFMNSS